VERRGSVQGECKRGKARKDRYEPKRAEASDGVARQRKELPASQDTLRPVLASRHSHIELGAYSSKPTRATPCLLASLIIVINRIGKAARATFSGSGSISTNAHDAPDATSWFVRTGGGPVLRTTRSPRILNVMIILLTCTTHAGCSNGDGAMSTASIMPPSSPAEVTKPDALSRPLPWPGHQREPSDVASRLTRPS
jgi:hypothetical protein